MKDDKIREEHVKKTLEQIATIDNMVGNPYYDLQSPQAVTVNICIDKSVPPAKFKPDPKNPKGWIANELTFRAMKKDIFALGSNIDELVEQYQCNSCKYELDRQFWYFCPYCGEKFKE